MPRIILWSTFISIVSILIQASVLANIPHMPVLPDLTLLIVLYVSFMNSSIAGSSAGFFSGLFLDFLSAAPIGLNAFTKSLTGFLAGRFSGSFNMNRIMLPVTLAVAGTVMKVVLSWVLSMLFGNSIMVYRIFSRDLWMEMAMNMFFAPLVFGLLGLFPSLFIDSHRSIE